MQSFLSKVFGRKKDDKDISPTLLSPGELLGERFEAISPNVSPSATKFLELDPKPNGSGETSRDAGFSLFRAKSRPSSPETKPKRHDTLPQLSLAFLEARDGPQSSAGDFLREADPDMSVLLSDATIGQRKLNPLEALILIRACSQAIIARGLETLGVMHPHWYSASPDVQRRLISQFINSLNANSTTSPSSNSPTTAFESEMTFTRPHDVAAVLRWGLRHLQLDGDHLGKDETWYTKFLEAEAAADYPLKAFSEQLAPNLPPAHLELLTSTLEIFSSLAAHAEANSASGSKLSKIFGLWLLIAQRVDNKDDFQTFYLRWERMGRMLEHLFLARIRDDSADRRMPVRLLELVRQYPYTKGLSNPMTDAKLLARPRITTIPYDALFIRLEVELPSEKRRPKHKINPFTLLADAFSLQIEGEHAELWNLITSESKHGSSPSPLSNVFADETIRFLSMVPGTDGPDVPVKSPSLSIFAGGVLSPHRRSATAIEKGKGKPAPTVVSGHVKPATDPTPVSALSPLDLTQNWDQFSTSGFFEVSPAIVPLASTLFDNDVEKTVPPDPPAPMSRSLSRRSSRSKRSKHAKSPSSTSPRKSEDTIRPTPTPAEAPVQPQRDLLPLTKATKVQIIQIDEAFVDFWSDALLDPITSNWPTFIICKFKSSLVPKLVIGVPEEGKSAKTLKWLILEHTHTIKPPLPPVPVDVAPRAASPSSESMSSPKKRFGFWSMNRSISASSVGSQKGKNKLRSPVAVGEMGELLEEGTSPSTSSKSPMSRIRRSLDISRKPSDSPPLKKAESMAIIKEVAPVAGAVAGVAAVVALSEESKDDSQMPPLEEVKSDDSISAEEEQKEKDVAQDTVVPSESPVVPTSEESSDPAPQVDVDEPAAPAVDTPTNEQDTPAQDITSQVQELEVRPDAVPEQAEKEPLVPIEQEVGSTAAETAEKLNEEPALIESEVSADVQDHHDEPTAIVDAPLASVENDPETQQAQPENVAITEPIPEVNEVSHQDEVVVDHASVIEPSTVEKAEETTVQEIVVEAPAISQEEDLVEPVQEVQPEKEVDSIADTSVPPATEVIAQETQSDVPPSDDIQDEQQEHDVNIISAQESVAPSEEFDIPPTQTEPTAPQEQTSEVDNVPQVEEAVTAAAFPVQVSEDDVLPVEEASGHMDSEPEVKDTEEQVLLDTAAPSEPIPEVADEQPLIPAVSVEDASVGGEPESVQVNNKDQSDEPTVLVEAGDVVDALPTTIEDVVPSTSDSSPPAQLEEPVSQEHTPDDNVHELDQQEVTEPSVEHSEELNTVEESQVEVPTTAEEEDIVEQVQESQTEGGIASAIQSDIPAPEEVIASEESVPQEPMAEAEEPSPLSVLEDTPQAPVEEVPTTLAVEETSPPAPVEEVPATVAVEEPPPPAPVEDAVSSENVATATLQDSDSPADITQEEDTEAVGVPETAEETPASHVEAFSLQEPTVVVAPQVSQDGVNHDEVVTTFEQEVDSSLPTDIQPVEATPVNLEDVPVVEGTGVIAEAEIEASVIDQTPPAISEEATKPDVAQNIEESVATVTETPSTSNDSAVAAEIHAINEEETIEATREVPAEENPVNETTPSLLEDDTSVAVNDVVLPETVEGDGLQEETPVALDEAQEPILEATAPAIEEESPTQEPAVAEEASLVVEEQGPEGEEEAAVETVPAVEEDQPVTEEVAAEVIPAAANQESVVEVTSAPEVPTVELNETLTQSVVTEEAAPEVPAFEHEAEEAETASEDVPLVEQVKTVAEKVLVEETTPEVVPGVEVEEPVAEKDEVEEPVTEGVEAEETTAEVIPAAELDEPEKVLAEEATLEEVPEVAHEEFKRELVEEKEEILEEEKLVEEKGEPVEEKEALVEEKEAVQEKEALVEEKESVQEKEVEPVVEKEEPVEETKNVEALVEEKEETVQEKEEEPVVEKEEPVEEKEVVEETENVEAHVQAPAAELEGPIDIASPTNHESTEADPVDEKTEDTPETHGDTSAPQESVTNTADIPTPALQEEAPSPSNVVEEGEEKPSAVVEEPNTLVEEAPIAAQESLPEETVAIPDVVVDPISTTEEALPLVEDTPASVPQLEAPTAAESDAIFDEASADEATLLASQDGIEQPAISSEDPSTPEVNAAEQMPASAEATEEEDQPSTKEPVSDSLASPEEAPIVAQQSFPEETIAIPDVTPSAVELLSPTDADTPVSEDVAVEAETPIAEEAPVTEDTEEPESVKENVTNEESTEPTPVAANENATSAPIENTEEPVASAPAQDTPITAPIALADDTPQDILPAVETLPIEAGTSAHPSEVHDSTAPEVPIAEPEVAGEIVDKTADISVPAVEDVIQVESATPEGPVEGESAPEPEQSSHIESSPLVVEELGLPIAESIPASIDSPESTTNGTTIAAALPEEVVASEKMSVEEPSATAEVPDEEVPSANVAEVTEVPTSESTTVADDIPTETIESTGAPKDEEELVESNSTSVGPEVDSLNEDFAETIIPTEVTASTSTEEAPETTKDVSVTDLVEQTPESAVISEIDAPSDSVEAPVEIPSPTPSGNDAATSPPEVEQDDQPAGSPEDGGPTTVETAVENNTLEEPIVATTDDVPTHSETLVAEPQAEPMEEAGVTNEPIVDLKQDETLELGANDAPVVEDHQDAQVSPSVDENHDISVTDSTPIKDEPSADIALSSHESLSEHTTTKSPAEDPLSEPEQTQPGVDQVVSEAVDSTSGGVDVPEPLVVSEAKEGIVEDTGIKDSDTEKSIDEGHPIKTDSTTPVEVTQPDDASTKATDAIDA